MASKKELSSGLNHNTETWFTRVCGRCGQQYATIHPFSRVCGPCRQRAKKARKKNGIGQGPRKVERRLPPAPDASGRKSRKDEMQHQLDRDLDARLYADCGTSPATVYRPGDPGFDEIARAVTPVSQIPERVPMEWTIRRWHLENEGFPVRQ